MLLGYGLSSTLYSELVDVQKPAPFLLTPSHVQKYLRLLRALPVVSLLDL